MSNYAWVCFSCRASVRRHGSSKRVLCSSCGQSCECIGYKIPVPPKSKPKMWEQLRLTYYQFKRERLLRQQKANVRRIHDLEQEIARLQAMPVNEGRGQAITHLKRQLAEARA